ncbi:MAG: MotA/TolQ/ExbB proton channel family protein, partial [Candidatus Omnitrophota bacterium]
IAAVSPMLGLLGTVLGMIKAFNFIAFDISVVKPVALAGAVAQALVTTAAGLIVAIPCMGFFFFFRGRLQSLIGRVEEVAVEIAEHISSHEEN